MARNRSTRLCVARRGLVLRQRRLLCLMARWAQYVVCAPWLKSFLFCFQNATPSCAVRNGSTTIEYKLETKPGLLSFCSVWMCFRVSLCEFTWLTCALVLYTLMIIPSPSLHRTYIPFFHHSFCTEIRRWPKKGCRSLRLTVITLYSWKYKTEIPTDGRMDKPQNPVNVHVSTISLGQ